MGTFSLPQGNLQALQPLSSAIGNAEGFGVAGAIPTRANNPGDLELGDLGYGTLGNGISIFPDAASGQNALTGFLANILGGGNPNYSPNMSLSQFGDVYVNGPNGGTSQGSQDWTANLAKSLGVPANTPIGLLPGLGGGSDASSGGILSDLASAASSGATSAIRTITGGRGLSDYVSIAVGLIFLAGALYMLSDTAQGATHEFVRGVRDGVVAA